jgi:8-oxo-dGTP diphosphatase
MNSRKRKSAKSSTKTPILAAGGIVLRHGARPLIAIVQRRKDNRWVLPKGKLKRRESTAAAAKREAIEETGQNVRVHEFLGAITYESRSKPKVTHFWRMQTHDGSSRELTRDIKAVEWLSLSDAIERLTHPLEQTFLSEIGRQVLLAARRRRGGKRRKAVRRVPGARRKLPAGRKSTRSRKSQSRPQPNLLRRIFRGLQTPRPR